MRDKPVSKSLLGVMPNDDILSKCIHCGMCLATCPTYEMTKLERSSPRGRIRMIIAVARGEMSITPTFADEMSFCLDCQACETACPAGVNYGAMVEAARVEVDHAGYGPPLGRLIKRIIFKYILPSKTNLKIVSRLLYIYQKSGLQYFMHKAGIFRLISRKLGEIDKLAPKVSDTFSDGVIPEVIKPEGEVKHKTAFLTGCLMNVMFADINIDTIDLLKAIGCEIFTPKDQVCCGSLNAHNGDKETARRLAKRNIEAFEKQGYEYLVSNSAGCGAFMKEYGHILSDDPEYAERAASFSAKVKDLTEFLAEIKDELEPGIIDETVTYHDACHLAHTQKVVEPPRTVLNSIPGLNVKPLEESTWCCGSAGIYNIVRYDESMVILERKMNNIKNTGSKIVLAANPGCISQIKYGAEKFNVNVEVLHPATFIKRSFVKNDDKHR